MVRLHARAALVRVGEEVHRCSLRKSLFRARGPYLKPLAVGDRVMVALGGRRGAVVEQVLPRRSELVRSAGPGGRLQVIASNVDQVAATASLWEPPLRPRLVDRLLVAAACEELDALILLNKVDLVADRSPFQELAELYRGLGYTVLFTSVPAGEGLAELRRSLEGRTTVFAGHSGVGKSSLLNSLQPELGLRTADISGKWNRGRHTTTAVSLLPLASGGHVVDTPGIRAFRIPRMEPWQLAACFPELASKARGCRFPTCSHTHEPGCAVKQALDGDGVDPRRYESYLRMLAGEEDLELVDEDGGEEPGE